MPSYTNLTKHSSTATNVSKNSSTFTNSGKTTQQTTIQLGTPMGLLLVLTYASTFSFSNGTPIAFTNLNKS